MQGRTVMRQAPIERRAEAQALVTASRATHSQLTHQTAAQRQSRVHGECQQGWSTSSQVQLAWRSTHTCQAKLPRTSGALRNLQSATALHVCTEIPLPDPNRNNRVHDSRLIVSDALVIRVNHRRHLTLSTTTSIAVLSHHQSWTQFDLSDLSHRTRSSNRSDFRQTYLGIYDWVSPSIDKHSSL
ncbi:hypothetical protein IE81DRAFT_37257 [Ceraceosorus guamensis]|uniref:Uncharacterized protein n=1 Tax=Ceraceosorus guamensis TaxID=1522189 RepID=A0A316W2R8_9BASI|nr:hypothetical protein IE81DRAFT_37257 [Ceraceosorus guamensis]PWN44187.1 hypothetical protein IE81DRAFT_37257 [Ceraceosorus guamensis]